MMSAIGDAVQVLPVVNALKRSFPSTRLTWLIQPLPHSLVAGHPGVDEFVLFNRGDRRKTLRALGTGVRGLWQAARALRAVGRRQPGGAFDLVLDLQSYFKAGILTAMVPGKTKLGFDWKRTRDLNWLFTTHRIPPNPNVHAHTQDQYFEFLRHLGVDPEPVVYGLDPTAGERSEQASFFRSIGRPVCSLVVATSDPRKDWSAQGYAFVLDALFHDFGLQPVLVGGVSRGFSGGCSRGGCGGGVGGWCPGWGSGEAREHDPACVLSSCQRGAIPRANLTNSGCDPNA